MPFIVREGAFTLLAVDFCRYEILLIVLAAGYHTY